MQLAEKIISFVFFIIIFKGTKKQGKHFDGRPLREIGKRKK
jgi:hypothetical protein